MKKKTKGDGGERRAGTAARKKQVCVTSIFWDFWPLMRMLDRKYDAKFVSIYKPWLKGRMSKDKVILFGERFIHPALFPVKIISRTFKLMRVIGREKPAVVNSQHDDANVSVVLAMIITKKILRRKAPKFYLWIRNNPLETHKTGFFGRVALFCYRHFYHLADRIFTQCEENRDAIVKAYPRLRGKIELFQNVFDIEENIRRAKEPLPAPEKDIFGKDKFVFINIGRLTEQKGHWYLLRAFEGVARKHPEARLVIITEGDLRSKVEDLTRRLGLEDKVFLLGNKENIFKYLGRSDCFVFPSLWEGFGNVIIEAMSVGLPVISSDCVAGPRKILAPELSYNARINYPYLGRYGVLIDNFPRKQDWRTLDEHPLSRNEKDLQDLMMRMIEDKRFRQRYSHGVKRAREFDIDNTLKNKGSLLD